ncbi:hypothetical protein PC41400_09580 [Paenibacillus chitinolyticus]|uniref:Uncharacterized protein n=1 Tax=Paenibacillus chitinolyticus TaxID=79263 RepID=A0A410WU94_9BACL|nr:hypothetical protein PC41400_09580 [Paenibacillus chitinolyticus]
MNIPNWYNVFEQTSIAKKKMMLSTIINKVEVKRDGIKIDFKLRISQFIGTMGAADDTQVDTGRILTDCANVINI